MNILNCLTGKLYMKRTNKLESVSIVKHSNNNYGGLGLNQCIIMELGGYEYIKLFNRKTLYEKD